MLVSYGARHSEKKANKQAINLICPIQRVGHLLLFLY